MPQPIASRAKLRVDPGSKVRLARIDPSETHGHAKPAAEKELATGLARLSNLQDRLWAEARAPGPGRPPGDRRGRQGRHHRAT